MTEQTPIALADSAAQSSNFTRVTVEIFSLHAAISGTPTGTTWKGQLYLDPNLSDESNLEIIYRLFNRVDEGDDERLERIGYRLPSLSVGDYVTLHGANEPVTYIVSSVGFVKLTGTEEGRNLLFRRTLA